MELVTGRTGKGHITSQQDRMKHQGAFGSGSYILKTGRQLEPELKSSNEIRIRDGALMCQGALGCVKANTYDPVTIQNGNQGMQRIDLIVWRYTYDAEKDIEAADWAVIKGTPSESSPQKPSYAEGSIQEGDAVVEIPVYAVKLDGINVTEVEKLLQISPTLDEVKKELTELNGNNTGYPDYADGVKKLSNDGTFTVTENGFVKCVVGGSGVYAWYLNINNSVAYSVLRRIHTENETDHSSYLPVKKGDVVHAYGLHPVGNANAGIYFYPKR